MSVVVNTFDKVFAELSQAVRLDKHDLDNQLQEHGELFRQVCDYHALYSNERDLADRAVEEIEASVAAEIRDDAAASGSKTTETEIKQRVMLDDRVKAAKAKLERLKLTVHRWAGLEKSYIERRHAFAKLVDLHGNQYWSEHSGIARSNKIAVDARRERVREVIKAKRER